MANEPALYARMEMRVKDAEKQLAKFAQRLDGEATGMERRWGKATKNMDNTMSRGLAKMEGYLSNFGKGLWAGIAAGGFAGITVAIQNVAKSFADLGREAKMAGVNVEDFQRWRYVADQNRIGIDALTDGFKELSLRASEYVTTAGKSGSAADAFRQLGLSPQEVQERIKDPSKFMLELIDRVQRLKNTAKGIQIFDELFGGQGGEQFVQLIEQGREGIAATLKEADAMGVVFDKEWIEKSAEIDRSFNRLATTMGTAVKGAIVEAATALEGFISSWNALNEKSVSGLKAELEILKQGRERLATTQPAGGLQDTIAGVFGKDRDSQLAAIAAKEKLINDELERRQAIVLKTVEIEGAPYKPIAAPTSGKSGAEKAREKAAKQSERERKAVTDLIKELEFEASLVGKTAVDKERMIALRHAGAAATEAEKQKIESLVESTYRANEAHERQKEALQELNDAGRDFAGTLVDGLLDGAKATDVLSNALKGLADRFLNSGLDALFGGGGIGGVFGSVFGGGKSDPWAGLRFQNGGLPKFSSGTPSRVRPGMVRGPGTGTSDSIVARISNKEFITNARSTQKYRGLLEAINEDRLPGFAKGMPSITAPRMPDLSRITNNNNNSSTMNNAPTINVNVSGANGNAEISAMVQQGLAKGLAEWQRTPQFAMSVGRGVQTARQKGFIR
ncbi:phage tail tape measure protein [Brucella intermedia]|uniref:phage tail tape measure protein n=1 Tax=Brucella intermedia TaxID=94625 RepID=UPI0023603B98|nr:phage tail tape measure protein [Brucella intermedia]